MTASVTITTADAAREWASILCGDAPAPTARGRLMRCDSCGGMRHDYGGPHAMRWVGDVLRDCVGREVRR